ncbi:MAG: hypothetical protein IK062_07475 [Selenomonadaceae bacterium]|nr:hypothetical protein [Selenomonadaceae bacterium]
MPIKFLKTLFENIEETDISKLLTEMFKTPKIKFDIEDFPSIFTEKIDKIILDKKAKSDENYVSGIFTIAYVDEKHYRCAFELYFEDKEGQINSISANSDLLDISNLTDDAIRGLKLGKIIKFKISEPTEVDQIDTK